MVMWGMEKAMQFVETENATEAAEDWSRVRSPSRARRRMKRGFPQNVRHYRKPAAYQMDGVTYIHPRLMKVLRERIDDATDHIDRAFADSIMYGRGTLYPGSTYTPYKMMIEPTPPDKTNWIMARFLEPKFARSPFFNWNVDG